jgi:hypothetical protein
MDDEKPVPASAARSCAFCIAERWSSTRAPEYQYECQMDEREQYRVTNRAVEMLLSFSKAQ